MPRKGMRSLCFSTSKTLSFSISRNSLPAGTSSVSTTPSRSFSDAMIDQSIEAAASMVTKWNPETSAYAGVTSIFYEDKREAHQFIKCVNDLQKAMHSLVSEDSTSERLIYSQSIMQIAMKRLQKEFYQILSMNRAHLDPESVSTRSSRTSARSSTSDYDGDDGDDEIRVAGDSISEVEQVSNMAMADLKSIAECMISAGYAKECINIYKVIRKSIIDEGIYRLGVERVSSSQINKMDLEVLELRIKNWLEAVKISMRTLFTGERILCDHVFASSDYIRESCFADIAREGALLLFGFPEIVAKSKKSQEKLFRVLDMYTAISENWPEIDSIFAFDSTAIIRNQALTSLIRLTESVNSILQDFESTVQKDSSKSKVHGGGVHPLTIRTMNYLSLLADYSNVLVDIFRDWPLPEKTSLPESYFDSSDPDESPSPAMSHRLAWLVLVLLCKIDDKAKHYKDISISYLFLANNLRHVVSMVRTSNLKYLLGDDWIVKHEAKVRQFAANYEKLAWDKVFSTFPENPTAEISPDQAKLIFRNFNVSFEETYRKQRSSVVPDTKLREEIKQSISRKLLAVYRQFYDKHGHTLGGERHVRVVVKYVPEEVENYLSGLFCEMPESDISSSSHSSSSSSSSSHRRQWRFL
ncbi:hypothetical protein FNV43_RR15957 [Rhamnella rubrinervis]|uniref:Exocyst subunit Exo70 family protein n=1 Tax=Rhamnella rubrinervis TaxID=2594499 RepID=A0A8K0E4G8_9ROSA|nr:hypothetical protein FNV43_RR15957 [Rhamnella rubrinervis]